MQGDYREETQRDYQIPIFAQNGPFGQHWKKIVCELRAVYSCFHGKILIFRFFYIVAFALKTCLIQKWKKKKNGKYLGGGLSFLGLAVLVIIVKGVCPLLLPLVSLDE